MSENVIELAMINCCPTCEQHVTKSATRCNPLMYQQNCRGASPLKRFVFFFGFVY